jgi:hypothetical protein
MRFAELLALMYLFHPELVTNSSIAAAGNLADHFRYGFVTGHRPGNLTERLLWW